MVKNRTYLNLKRLLKQSNSISIEAPISARLQVLLQLSRFRFFYSFFISMFEIRICDRKLSSLGTALILYLVVNIKEILCFTRNGNYHYRKLPIYQ